MNLPNELIWNWGLLTALTYDWLDFLKPRLAQSRATIVIPLNDRVLSIRPRTPKSPKPSTRSPGVQLRVGCGGRASRGFLTGRSRSGS